MQANGITLQRTSCQKINYTSYFPFKRLNSLCMSKSIVLQHAAHLSRLMAVMMMAQATWLQLSREEMTVQSVFPNTQCPPRAHWWMRKGMTVTCTRSAPARLHMYTSGTVFLGDLCRDTCDWCSLIIAVSQQTVAPPNTVWDLQR